MRSTLIPSLGNGQPVTNRILFRKFGIGKVKGRTSASLFLPLDKGLDGGLDGRSHLRLVVNVWNCLLYLRLTFLSLTSSVY